MEEEPICMEGNQLRYFEDPILNNGEWVLLPEYQSEDDRKRIEREEKKRKTQTMNEMTKEMLQQIVDEYEEEKKQPLQSNGEKGTNNQKEKIVMDEKKIIKDCYLNYTKGVEKH